ncbi:hypothetical protein SAMN02745132_03274 [Enterovibrio nigricans DSM 22720]|uniref:Uncharacterized protein n=2 Tax=Enterovibrio nigricans TaxID=504469 RepID=A0A1T4V5Y9_9GAMM|nr:hypothetical protein SAMN02745132_03274 [Enterovibrio nigricans DSM 22720]
MFRTILTQEERQQQQRAHLVQGGIRQGTPIWCAFVEGSITDDQAIALKTIYGDGTTEEDFRHQTNAIQLLIKSTDDIEVIQNKVDSLQSAINCLQAEVDSLQKAQFTIGAFSFINTDSMPESEWKDMMVRIEQDVIKVRTAAIIKAMS